MLPGVKKGKGGSKDPDEQKLIKNTPSGPPKKSAVQPSEKDKTSEPTHEAPKQPKATVAPTSPPQAGDKGKAPLAPSRTSAPPLPAFTMPKTSAAAERMVKYGTPPIPPPTAHQAASSSKSKNPAGTHRAYLVKGPSGALSEHSEKSIGDVSLSTTAYSEPPMEFQTEGRKLRNNELPDGAVKLVSYLRGGRFFKFRLVIDGEPQTGKTLTALMLNPGQGGTFGFGNAFWKNSKHDAVVISGSPERARDDKSKVKHLFYYGKDVSMIGTSGCISCVGVYFELRGNRVFCAHINALHHEGRETKPDMEPGSQDYFQMREMMRRRFEGVSKRDGWSRIDYLSGTLKLVCPNPNMAGYAVVESINEFLGTQEEVVDSPGFVFKPGLAKSPTGPHGSILLRTHAELDGSRKYEAVPDEIRRVYSTGHHGDNVIQPWTYTTGPGPNRGWNWAQYTAGRIIRSRSNDVITDAAEPGFLSAK